MEAALDAAAAKAVLLSTKLVEDAKKRLAGIKRRQEERDKRCGISIENPLPQVLKLNVGGDIEFVVRRETLTMLPSRFSQMFSGRWDKILPRDPDGRIFLDMDPAQVRAVHNWLVQMKKVGKSATKPPHPREKLSEAQSFGFDYFLKYMQLDKHLSDAAPIYSTVLTTGQQYDRLLTILRLKPEEQPDIDIELLFRASRDGQTFHAKCDSKGATVVVAKSKGGFIFGGYTDTPWDSTNAYKSCRSSFLFRLDGPGLVAPSTHPVYQNHGHAILTRADHGPTFGSGPDFHIPINGQTASSNVGSTYNPSGQNGTVSVLAESNNVSLVDYEVYAVKSTPCQWQWRDLQKVEDGLPLEFKDLFLSVRALAESAQAVGAEADAAERELSKSEAGLHEEAEFIESYTSMFQERGAIVRLNVSGRPLWTTRATLLQEEDSVLAAKFSPTWTLQEDELVDGAVFFEEDPDCFCHILQHLRLLRMGGSDVYPLLSASQRDSYHALADYLGLKKVVAIMDSSSRIVSVSQLQRLKEWMPPGSTSHRLLFSASRDGFTSQAFHSKCDNQGATLVVAQTTSGFVVGGYTQAPWDSASNYKASPTSFLFVLQGPGIVSPSKHSILQNPGHAMYCNPSYGPTFGGNHDLHIPSGAGPSSGTRVSMRLGHTYNKTGDGVHAVDVSDTLHDYEVFGFDA